MSKSNKKSNRKKRHQQKPKARTSKLLPEIKAKTAAINSNNLSISKEKPLEPVTSKKVNILKSTLKQIMGVIGFIGSLLGFYLGYLALVPRPVVSQVVSAMPTTLLATSFSVTNNGYLPMYNAEFSCGVINVDAKGKQKLGGSKDKGLRIVKPDQRASVIKYTQSYSAKCSQNSFGFIGENSEKQPITNADIEILVSFKPWLLPWREEKSFRFTTVTGDDNKLQWVPRLPQD